MGAMSPTHWLIVLGVLLLLFGAKKLPDVARSVGQSARVLKGEMSGLHDDDQATTSELDRGDGATGATAHRPAGERARPNADGPSS